MPAQYQVSLTQRARADLHRIYDYIARDSIPNAREFVAKLVKAIMSLHELPNRHPTYNFRRRNIKGVRRMPLWPYLIYYAVDEKQLAVKVITIRHGMRHQP